MKHKILSWIIVIVGALAVVVPVGLLVAWWFTGGSALWADQADGPTSDPYIYVDTEREVSPGQAFSLNPLYYNEHGLPEPGHRFSFEVSDEQVIKQNRDRGTDADSFSVLTASEEPQTITVVERNGKARTEVTVWITSELSEVYKRSEASVVAQYGAQFTLEVGTNPAESSITGRNVEITYAVLGPNGEQLTDSADATAGDDGDVFSLVETNAHALTFKANGLGTGKLCVTFRNDERQLKTTLVWEFGISLKETVLQNALIAEGTSALYGASDLAEIEALTLTDFPAQVDFSELSAALPNVKEIVLDGSDHILRNVGLPADCTFYVPETMLAQYGAAWGQDFRSVLPMQAYRGTLCAVLHEDYLSETSSSLSCWEAGDGALPELNDEANGYVFSGWYTEPEGGEPVTERPAGSTHLFAQWAPKGYRVTFDAAGPADQQFESLAVEYGEAIPKPLPQPVFDTWEFEGWHVDTIDGALFTADEPYPYTHDVALVARYKGTLTLSDKVAGEDETLPGVTYNLPLEASGAFPGLPQEKAASEGWSFEYWTSDAQLREKVEPSAPYTGKGNATLYARRAGTITLSDNLKTTENGSEETSSVTFYYGVTPSPYPRTRPRVGPSSDGVIAAPRRQRASIPPLPTRAAATPRSMRAGRAPSNSTTPCTIPPRSARPCAAKSSPRLSLRPPGMAGATRDGMRPTPAPIPPAVWRRSPISATEACATRRVGRRSSPSSTASTRTATAGPIPPSMAFRSGTSIPSSTPKWRADGRSDIGARTASRSRRK